MKSINFDEGYREYKLNGDVDRIVRIQITDPNLMGRITAAMDKTNELIEKYKGQPDATQLAEFDADIKAVLNEAFGTDICSAAFGSTSVMTPVAGGKLLLFAFFDAFIPALEEDLKALQAEMQTEKVRPEVQKYLEPAALPDVSGLTPEQKRELMAQLI